MRVGDSLWNGIDRALLGGGRGMQLIIILILLFEQPLTYDPPPSLLCLLGLNTEQHVQQQQQ